MPRWGDKDVCHLQMIDAIGDYSKSLTKQTTTNTAKNKKIQLKSARRNCRSHLNHKLFIENFIYDPLNVFFNPIGTNINRIMLLRGCAKRREKETQVHHKNFYLNAYCPQKNIH